MGLLGQSCGTAESSLAATGAHHRGELAGSPPRAISCGLERSSSLRSAPSAPGRYFHGVPSEEQRRQPKSRRNRPRAARLAARSQPQADRVLTCPIEPKPSQPLQAPS
jgi:hypothetical protein